jgi:hypothetical protein
VERHILRNYIFLHAIAENVPLPIGTQDAEMLDPAVADDEGAGLYEDDDDDNGNPDQPAGNTLRNEADYKRRAAEIYHAYTDQWKRRFKWLRPSLFVKALADDLRDDIKALLKVLSVCGEWDPTKDAKLNELWKLLVQKHPKEKVLIFTQFADTVGYLEEQLAGRGLTQVAGATGDSEDPTALAWRFSPL